MLDTQYGYKLEREGKWREAENFWKRFSGSEYETMNGKACKMIADAIEAGDAMRAADKETVYTIFEGVRGNFYYDKEYREAKNGERLVGRVLGIGEATEAVVSLEDNRSELDRVITGIKMDFPNIN